MDDQTKAAEPRVSPNQQLGDTDDACSPGFKFGNTKGLDKQKWALALAYSHEPPLDAFAYEPELQ
jgi:hypothetical protein